MIPIKISIVEDLKDVREEIVNLLSLDKRFEMISAFSNAELATKDLPSQKPDIVIMDINLPGISGIEALKILRGDPATAHIPVIALSANAMPRDIERGLQAGFFRYLTKPIKVTEFMKTLEETLEFAAQEAVLSK